MLDESCSTSEPPVVQVEGLSVCFQIDAERIGSFKEHVLRRILRGEETEERWALRGVDLEIRSGEVFGVFGRNGAGKSTLLRVLAQTLEPTEGRVRVRGRVAPLLAIGSGFHPDMSARENVMLNASLLGRTFDEARSLYPEIVDFSELGGSMHLPLRQLSSGMAARLGFAVATAVRPDLLLVDEVLAVGDIAFQEKCLARIEDFRRRGTAIVLVSHQRRAVDWCSRGLFLESGRAVTSGPPEELRLEFDRQYGAETSQPHRVSSSVEESSEEHQAEDPDESRESRAIETLIRGAGREVSAAIAVRLFSEVRSQAAKHGLDVSEVHQLGPGCLPGTLACFLATGSGAATSSGTVSQQPHDIPALDRLVNLLKIAGGQGWWRLGLETQRQLPMTSPRRFPEVRLATLQSRVRLGVPLDAARPTLVFSFGTLAHVPAPAALLEEMAAALPAGAGMIHEIDLFHLGDRDPLASLELSDAAAREARAKRTADFHLPEVPPGVEPVHAYCNRWLASDWVRGLEENGFEVLDLEPTVLLDAREVRPERLAPRYRDREIDDLRTLVVRITSRRRS